MRILVLMTCHSRRNLTLQCILSAEKSASLAGCTLFWSVTDDGSTDDTSQVVKDNCQSFLLDQKGGDLYWTRGMKNSWNNALKIDLRWDFVLWLNDDVELAEHAIGTLLSDFSDSQVDIVAGHCSDTSQELSTSYGGFKLRGRRPTSYLRTSPEGILEPIDTFNGNVVLMRVAVAQQVSLGDFSHMYGDIDFGLKAKSLAFGLFGSSKYVGICRRNSAEFPWLNSDLNLRSRLTIFFGPKGLVFLDHLKFHRTHCGYILGSCLTLVSYVRALFRVLIIKNE